MKNKTMICFCCTYNPKKSLIENHLRQLQKKLEASCERYDHFLIMGDCPRSFHKTYVSETGSSDFHKLIVTILQTSFEPFPHKIIKHRYYVLNKFAPLKNKY